MVLRTLRILELLIFLVEKLNAESRGFGFSEISISM